MIYLKIHATGQRGNHRFVIAVCDKDLIGKTLKEKNIEIHVSEKFYKGDLKEENEVIEFIRDASNVNMLGKEAVNAGIEAGIITQEDIIMIAGVPHAQAVAF